MFANLHTHTDYSVLDGMMDTKSVFSAAKQNGYKAIAITEHGNLSSVFIALKESKSTGVKFIPGIEFNIKDKPTDENPRHIVVLASSHDGLKSIMRTSYTSYDRDVDRPYILWEDLGMLERDGVFVLSGCADGILSITTLLYGPRAGEEVVDKLQTLFGDRFYIEVNTPYDDRQAEINLLLEQLSKKKGVPMVLALDSHFLKADDQSLFNIFVSIQNKGSIYEKGSMFYVRPHLMTEDEIRAAAGPGLSEAIDNSVVIADMCDDPVEYLATPSRFMMPVFDVKKMKDYNEFMAWKARR